MTHVILACVTYWNITLCFVIFKYLNKFLIHAVLTPYLFISSRYLRGKIRIEKCRVLKLNQSRIVCIHFGY